MDPDGNADRFSSCSIITDTKGPRAWKNLRDIFQNPSEIPIFANAQVVNYFAARTATDGLEANDFKLVSRLTLQCIFSMWSSTKNMSCIFTKSFVYICYMSS